MMYTASLFSVQCLIFLFLFMILLVGIMIDIHEKKSNNIHVDLGRVKTQIQYLI